MGIAFCRGAVRRGGGCGFATGSCPSFQARFLGHFKGLAAAGGGVGRGRVMGGLSCVTRDAGRFIKFMGIGASFGVGFATGRIEG